MAKIVLNGGHSKIQNGVHPGICANINIVLQIPHVITFLKLYRFLIYHDSEQSKNEPV